MERWIYTPQGKPAFFQQDEHVYTPDGRYAYWEDNNWWFRVGDGMASFYMDDDHKWLFTPSGQPAYYYGD
jgi:hypothetical protein